MPTSVDIPSSRHFQIHTISNGVYAAIHKDGGWSICNSGIIDLGKKTIIFDTGLTPEAARDLKSTAETLTGKSVDYVVNSHFHKDHIRGNQVFNDSTIVSTHRTQTLIGEEGVASLESDKTEAPKQLEDLSSLAQRSDPEIQEYVRLFLPYWQGIIDSLKEVELHLPNLIFRDRHILSGTERSAVVIDVGGGHSENDCVLHLPEEKAVFCGDLLFVGSHPYMGESDPEVWISILNRLEELDVDVCMPGHGEIGTSEALDNMIAYIQELVLLVQDVVNHRGNVEDAIKIPVPTQYSEWKLALPFFESNIRFLYEKLS
ncbi:MAG: MBL fold metallo-hydrolase [Candidatus Thorarchaeota archaeon]|jgi:glyoxylase-like metal-dependent hydrolase (beta-lactamase superfamily II)